MKLIRYGLVAVAMAAAVTVSMGAGYFPGWPIVGGAAYCSSYVINPLTGAATTTCSGGGTIAAGPTAITGNELVPTDTQASSGAAPQTVLMSMRALRAAPLTYYLCTAAVCGTQTIADNSGGILVDYSGTITSMTINLPTGPMDGQRVSIASSYTITTSGLTVVAGAGTTLSVTTPTILTASTTVPQGYEFMYVASVTKWFRIR